jgi:uncharacterized delta-60 repeat protein
VQQADGRLVAAGYDGVGGVVNFAVARLNGDGTPDTTFGGTGVVHTDFGSAASATSIAVQPDGKLVVAGNAGSGIALARYETNGTLDPAFGTGGLVTYAASPTGSTASAVAIDAERNVVVAGAYNDPAPHYWPHFLVARFNALGELDRRFGNEGSVRTPVSSYSADGAAALAVKANGDLIAAGSATGASSSSDLALIGYRNNPVCNRATGGVPSAPVGYTGNPFLSRTIQVLYNGGTVRVAGSADGTQPVAVDDKLLVSVTHPDETVSSASFDYSNGCVGVTPAGPHDITSLLQPGLNLVRFTFKDVCGVFQGSGPVWLSLPAASFCRTSNCEAMGTSCTAGECTAGPCSVGVACGPEGCGLTCREFPCSCDIE